MLRKTNVKLLSEVKFEKVFTDKIKKIHRLKKDYESK